MKVQFHFGGGGNQNTDIIAKMCEEHPECKGCPLFCETGTNIQGFNTICDTAVFRIRSQKTSWNNN